MDWVLHENMGGKVSLPPLPLPIPFFQPLQPPPPPPLYAAAEINFGNTISPSILLIIVILAVIFFVSGLLHLLVRYLLKPTDRDPESRDSATALQGQLQQLFHLHDSGVDQSFIDALPVFLYKAIIGRKDPFDCAVCLCEFEAQDKLRLLPNCSHAFHIDCIDTWLLSHSTCPLCRGTLIPDFSPNNSCSPIVLVLESRSESSREIHHDRRDSGPYSHPGLIGGGDELDPPIHENLQKAAEIESKEDLGSADSAAPEAKVVHVKLGKLRNVDAVCGGGEGSSSANSNLDQRRCFSMGSFEYVMDESSLLQVSIKPLKNKPRAKEPWRRLAMSECDCHSKREEFKAFDPPRTSAFRGECGRGDSSITSYSQKRESFSFSKIWLQINKEAPVHDSSRRAFSFRLPFNRQATDESKVIYGASPNSEFGVVTEKSWSEVDLDLEFGSCNSRIGSLAEEPPSFARRTLLWIVGRQNKVGSQV